MFNNYVVCTTNNALQEALLGAIYNKQTHYEQQLRVSFACTLQAESFLTLYMLKREKEQNCNMLCSHSVPCYNLLEDRDGGLFPLWYNRR